MKQFYESVINSSVFPSFFFTFFLAFLYHRLTDQRRRYTYVVMYTSECRTITNVNMIERGRYRGCLFTAITNYKLIKIGI